MKKKTAKKRASKKSAAIGKPEKRKTEIEGLKYQLKIEAALEKIRARTMAMHQSAELRDAGNMVFQQMKNLGIEAETSWLWFIDNEKGGLEIWVTHENKLADPVKVKASDMWTFKREIDGWKKGKPFLNLTIPKKEAQQSIKKIFGVKIKSNRQATHFHLLQTRHRFGFLGLGSWHEATGEEQQICSRFAKVFEQTYTRFLDLQKAEAQAREAQIEAALERIRSRSMAMHKTDELWDVIDVVFKQFTLLEIRLETCYIDIFEGNNWDFHMWIGASTATYPENVHVPFIKHPIFLRSKEARVKKENFYLVDLDKNSKDKFFKHFYTQASNIAVPKKRKELIAKGIGITGTVCVFKNFSITMWNYQGTAYSEEENEILRKVGKVFEQSYTRFLDLQKAEAQAREAKIEAALERVRSKTMAMHSSEDVGNTMVVLFEELVNLGIEADRNGILIMQEDHYSELWTARPDSKNKVELLFWRLDMDLHEMPRKVYKAWKNRKSSFEYELMGDSLKAYYKILNDLPDFPGKFDLNTLPAQQWGHFFNFDEGCIYLFASHRMPEENVHILNRFSAVFGQTYRRYKDLEKAEAQAREAQIEAALERVRSRSLAMHNSDELNEVIAVLYEQLQLLHVGDWGCSLNIFKASENYFEIWLSTDTQRISLQSFRIVGQGHQIIKENWEIWKSQDQFRFIELKGPVKMEYDDYVMSQTGLKDLPDNIKKSIKSLPESYASIATMKHGTLNSYTGKSPLSKTDFIIIQRFARVFEQAYTRFLDLQRAEAQAREAQIEAALERVRSRTMAMHQSEELSETAAVLFEQLQILGNTPERINLGIFQEESGLIEWWITTQEGFQIKKNFITKFDDHPVLERMISAWNANEKSNVVSLSGKAVTEWVQYITQFLGMPVNPKLVKEKRFLTSAFFSQGLIGTTTSEPLPVETIQLLERFAKVFEQTYTRFLDLQKAEAQAREAQVEAALERVRAKAMAMHSSQDLADTIGTFYKQLETFNLVPRRCGVGLLNKHNKEGEVYTWNTAESGESLQLVGKIKMEGHPVLENVYKNWITKTEYHPVLRGNEIKKYYEVIRPQMAFPEHQGDEFLYGYFFMFEEGGVYAWKEMPLKEDELKIYRRFTSVLSLTYKRYRDLVDAETRALEAKRQASLDKVRGEIASMRSTEDLQRINPLVWQELTAMEIPFTRCGVFIMDESEGLIHAYLSAPGGRSLGVLHLPFKSTQFTADAIDHWRKQKMYLTHWNQDQFVQNMKTMIEQGQIEETATYQGSDKPPESLHLHFINFKQGMLYVGNDAPLNQDAIESVKTLANSFSVAYARYEDFKKLEAAKVQVEKTLSDLKAAQSQLIQSEKMASLGELTAGIAHEIQNPLNFVNNFSEVSNELLVEMKEEIEKGNVEEVKAIAEDVIANLEKILHHGRRADGIVKGMLQHSRSSSGKKEPTDINALGDEYLRLAYHGLRAKDKSFNAKFETEFDKNIGKVHVVPQDIGRVILNLITNAFYVVNERLRQAQPDNGYEPTVTVSTKKLIDKIEIRVKDNGNGIPDSIKEKIFQPFFTTKPTGQGTGLGLSLSYDIVKAHGGELRVETQESVGSEFTIELPFV